MFSATIFPDIGFHTKISINSEKIYNDTLSSSEPYLYPKYVKQAYKIIYIHEKPPKNFFSILNIPT